MIQTLTDSIIDIPNEVMKKLGIEVIPMTSHVNSKVYRDVMDIDLENLFEQVVEIGTYPRTSAPSPEDIRDYFSCEAHDINIGISSPKSLGISDELAL